MNFEVPVIIKTSRGIARLSMQGKKWTTKERDGPGPSGVRINTKPSAEILPKALHVDGRATFGQRVEQRGTLQTALHGGNKLILLAIRA